MPKDLPFTDKVPVTVETLAGLSKSGRIPDRVGVIKIDTEGFDLEVIRGLGDLKADVIMTSSGTRPTHSENRARAGSTKVPGK